MDLQHSSPHVTRPLKCATQNSLLFQHLPSSTTYIRSKRKASPSFFHCALSRVGAAWPRLGRAFRTAPVSRQTKPNRVWHSPRFPSRPATLLPASVLSLRPCRLVFPRCRSGERKNKPTPAEGKKHEIRRSQHKNQRGRGFPRRSIGARSQ